MTYPPSPPSCEEGRNEDRFCEGLRERFWGFHGLIYTAQSHRVQPLCSAIKQALLPYPLTRYFFNY